MEYGIKLRLNKPASPLLNGKVERSLKTDLEEFWARMDLKDPKLEEKLVEWQDYYNHYRVHGSLKNLTPWERWKELELKTPLYEEADAMFDESKERIKLQNYWADLQQAKAHKSKKEGQKQEAAEACPGYFAHPSSNIQFNT